MSHTKIHLTTAMFSPRERVLIEAGPLTASTFQFERGVQGLRFQNGAGELVLLPFQGQQIWSASFGGRNITMKSMFSEPNPTRDYLSTYGGFLLHCGATAMGVPSKEDTHPVHGELPNAPYQQAWVEVGEDDGGQYLALGGEYQHTVAFSFNYVAHPLVKLYAGAQRCQIGMTVTNLKRTPMEFMYMAHVNFCPVDNGRLVYSAHCTPETVTVRKSIPSHVRPTPAYIAYLKELAQHPERHNLLVPELAFDPEVVLNINYLADAEGWAHSLQIHPDGNADYIRHRPAQLDKGVRWICRTPDQDALGLVLPSTAEAEGYTAEKAKGNVKIIGPQASFTCEMEAGVLDVAGTATMEQKIQGLLAT